MVRTSRILQRAGQMKANASPLPRSIANLNHPTEFSQRVWTATVITDQRLDQLADGDTPGDGEFRLLADGLPILCWIARGDGYIHWYNRRWHDYCGTTPDAMQGWGWQDVHDPELLPDVMVRWTDCIARGEAFEMLFPLRGADGHFRPFLTRAAPVRDASGEVVRWFGVNTEVGAQVRAEAALSDSEAKYTVLTEAMPQMVWSTLPDGFHDYFNAQWYEFTGMPTGSTDGEGWADMFHVEDQPRAWSQWQHSLDTGEPYEIEYRLRHHSGAYRWTLGRALPVRDASGRIIRWIGTCTDIHDAKLASEKTEVLSRELSHRIKNIFAVIAGLVGLSARQEPESRSFADRLSQRIMALGRAHEFARPHSDESRPQFDEEATLNGMLAELMAPYQIEGQQRIRISGPDLAIDDQAATPVALVFHELATNAAKYGALSTANGQVSITSRREGDRVVIDWLERGGPPVTGVPNRRGFGTQLAEMSVERQLGGTISREWQRDGLALSLTLDIATLTRQVAHPDRVRV